MSSSARIRSTKGGRVALGVVVFALLALAALAAAMRGYLPHASRATRADTIDAMLLALLPTLAAIGCATETARRRWEHVVTRIAVAVVLLGWLAWAALAAHRHWLN